MIKRLLEIIFALFFIIILIVPLIVIYISIKISTRDTPIFWSKRVGKDNKIFHMPKFRTMKKDTPIIATHLISNPREKITGIGFFLRKYSLDEIPQIFSIIRGDLSFVGPRPALFNQSDLIQLRTRKNIHKIKPGITGWAQVNGRDRLSIEKKVEYDDFYCKQRKSIFFDLYIIYLTFIQIIKKSDISH